MLQDQVLPLCWSFFNRKTLQRLKALSNVKRDRVFGTRLKGSGLASCLVDKLFLFDYKWNNHERSIKPVSPFQNNCISQGFFPQRKEDTENLLSYSTFFYARRCRWNVATSDISGVVWLNFSAIFLFPSSNTTIPPCLPQLGGAGRPFCCISIGLKVFSYPIGRYKNRNFVAGSGKNSQEYQRQEEECGRRCCLHRIAGRHACCITIHIVCYFCYLPLFCLLLLLYGVLLLAVLLFAVIVAGCYCCLLLLLFAVIVVLCFVVSCFVICRYCCLLLLLLDVTVVCF